jgi:hypothetical protein
MILIRKIFKKSKSQEISKNKPISNEDKDNSQSENIKESKKSENISQSEEEEKISKSEEIPDSEKKEDIIKSEEKEEDSLIKIESQNIGTQFYLCDLIEKANFLIDNNNIIVEIPKEKMDKNNSTKITDLTVEIYNNEIIGIIKEIDNKEINNKQDIDNDVITLFLIKWQNYLSLINYKLNNNKRLNNFEKALIDILSNGNKNTIRITEEISENDNLTLKNLSSKRKKLPDIFYDDAKKIEKEAINNYVNDINSQIKLDIFNYLFGKNKKSIKYEKEMKKVCNYYINQLYPKTAIVYSITNNNKEVEHEAIVTSSKIMMKKKTLLYC